MLRLRGTSQMRDTLPGLMSAHAPPTSRVALLHGYAFNAVSHNHSASLAPEILCRKQGIARVTVTEAQRIWRCESNE